MTKNCSGMYGHGKLRAWSRTVRQEAFRAKDENGAWTGSELPRNPEAEVGSAPPGCGAVPLPCLEHAVGIIALLENIKDGLRFRNLCIHVSTEHVSTKKYFLSCVTSMLWFCWAITRMISSLNNQLSHVSRLYFILLLDNVSVYGYSHFIYPLISW